jgi:hypothetical protein
VERVQEEEHRLGQEGLGALAFTLVALLPLTALADPVWQAPAVGTGGFHEGGLRGGLLLDARLIGVLAADRLATWPDRQLGLEDETPTAVAVHVGVRLELARDWDLVLELDLAELLRPEIAGEVPWDDVPRFAMATLDHAFVRFEAYRELELVVGRSHVPFGKQRQFDELDLGLGAVAFVTDRLAPDRRAGLLLAGDFGALAYAAGVFEDLEALEGSPEGAGLAALHVEWTPIAPIYGSYPPGKIPGARGPLPTPRQDPWFDTMRVSVGAGALLRLDEQGKTETRFSASLQAKWKMMAGLAEVISSTTSGTGVYAELIVTPIDAVSIHARGELDSGEANGALTYGGGVSYAVTADRRSRMGVAAWKRTVKLDDNRERHEDAAIVLLQTSL